jgi:hypothetical protein
MKKKILSGVFALALLVTAGYGVNKSMNSDVNLSDLALSNVEALANTESGNRYYSCDQGEENHYGTEVFWCGTCTYKYIKTSNYSGECQLYN